MIEEPRLKIKNKLRQIKNFVPLLSVIGLCVLITGISFAFFAYSKTGIYTHSITGGKLGVTYNENTGNNITIANAYPRTDAEALTKGLEFEFSVTGYNESHENVYYAVEIVHGADIAGKNRFLDSDMKLTFYENDQVVFENKIFNNLNNEVLDYGYILSGTSKNNPVTNTYKLRIWINDNVLITNTPDTIDTTGKNVYSSDEFANGYANFKININATNIDDLKFVTYDSNGGIGNAVSTIIGKENITDFVPVKEGYSFLGWSTNKNSTVAEYKSGATYSGEAVTLYAVWKISLKTLVELIKSKVGSDGLVAINTNGTLVNGGDTVREYRYSGSSKYCTYTENGTTYNIAVEGNTCPKAVSVDGSTFFCRDTYFSCDVIPNQTSPLDGEVNNYIWYNEEMWRIIGVFKETKGDGTEEELVKIIREEPLTNVEVPETYIYNGIEMTIKDMNYADYKYAYVYWNYDNYFNQANENDWTKAAIQYYLNDETSGKNSYYNGIDQTYQGMIETVQYNISNVDYGATASAAYMGERSGNVHSGNQAKWTGKIGMMYPSDFAYAAESGAWSIATSESASKANPETLNNWMNDSYREFEWTISPDSYDYSTVFGVDFYGYVSPITAWGYGLMKHPMPVSPVLYLKSSVMVTSGDGSEGSPYRIS